MRRLLSSVSVAALLAALAATPAGADTYARDAASLARKGDMRGAQIQYRNALRDSPGSAELHYGLARTDMALADAIAAEKEARLALDNGYDRAAATSLLLRSYLVQGRFADLLRDFPPPPQPSELAAVVLSGRSAAQLALGNPDAADASAKDARAAAPGLAAAVMAERQVAIARADLPRADALLQEALAAGPPDADLLRAKGQWLARTGDHAAALASLDEAVAADPGNSDARLDRATLLLAMNKEDAARRDVDAVLVLVPRAIPAILLRTELEVRAKDWAAADADLARLSPVRSHYPGAYLLEAVVKANLGQKQQALSAAERYNGRFPGDIRGARLYAELNLDSNRPDTAISALRPVTTGPQADAEALNILGRAYASVDAWQDSAAALERSVAIKRDPAVLVRLGQLRLRTGEAARALDALNGAEAAGASGDGLQVLIATAAIAAGDNARAEAALGRVPPAGMSGGAQVLRGTLALAKLDTDTAKAAFTAALAASPESDGAALGLARVALLQGDVAGSRRLLSGVLDRDPANLQALEAMAAPLGSPQADVITLLQRAHGAAPNKQDISLALVRAYLKAGQWQKAADLSAAADTTGAFRAEFLFLHAAASAALGDPGAADQYRAIVAATPNNAAAWAGLVGVLSRRADLADARSTAAAALKAQPGSPMLMRLALSVELKAGGLPQALAAADRLAADPANMPAAGLLRGELYVGADQLPEAAASYAKALALTPTAEAALRLATVQGSMNQPQAEVATLRQWLGAHPDDLPVMLALSGVQIAAGQLPDAEDLLSRLRTRLPNDPTVLNNLAWLRGQRGAPDAEALARRAFQLAPNAESADTLGWIMASGPAPAAAVPLLRMSAGSRPDDPEVAFHLAVALQRSGQTGDAVKVLDPVLRADKPFRSRADAVRAMADWSGRN